jgi:SAM-dependent methyltransferase
MAGSVSPGPLPGLGESPFACPRCRVALDFEHRLECPRCGTRYQGADGVASFNDAGLHHGPILPKAQMAEVLALVREKGYRYVVGEYLAERDPDFARYISARARTGGLALLPLRGDERVLDFGCAFGVLALELAKRAALVVALDVTREKIEFLEIVRRQDVLKTFFPVCNGDPLRLPFLDGFFDAIVLNAVFEYLPKSIAVRSVRNAHLLALREVGRVLRPGGRLYLATKNRYGYSMLLGARDHDGLRFTSVLPRAAAEWLTRAWRGGPYRTVTHSFGGYRRLLREAGFRHATVYWPLPSLQYPERFVPLTGTRHELRAALAAVKPARTVTGFCWHAAARLGLVPWLAPQYVMVAER